jgi:hypothetical protein
MSAQNQDSLSAIVVCWRTEDPFCFASGMGVLWRMVRFPAGEAIDRAGDGRINQGDRTGDLGIMSPSGQIEGEEDKGLGSAKSSKARQNPQQNRNNE